MKKKIELIQSIIFSLLIVALSLIFIILPKKTISEKENRSLAKFPTFNTDTFFSGKFTANIADYMADHFPLRDQFVECKAYSSLFLGIRENNDVMYLENDTLVPKPEEDDEILKKNLDSIKNFSDDVDGITVLSILPRPIDAYNKLLPSLYDYESEKEVWNKYYEYLKENNLEYVDMYDLLANKDVYYRTDHHYTSDGAYMAYVALSTKLGYTPYEKEYFKIEEASSDFLGTSCRTSGFYGAKRDKVVLYRYEEDENYNIIADGKEITLYDFDKLNVTDKYAVFLSGNHSLVEIKSDEEKPKLLVIRDSYFDSICPFLALHFDITAIDLRYYQGNVKELASDCDKTLVLMSMANLSYEGNLSRLKMPKENK